jgi:hypothetical protein
MDIKKLSLEAGWADQDRYIYEVVSKIFRTDAVIYTAVMVARSTGGL